MNLYFLRWKLREYKFSMGSPLLIKKYLQKKLRIISTSGKTFIAPQFKRDYIFLSPCSHWKHNTALGNSEQTGMDCTCVHSSTSGSIKEYWHLKLKTHGAAPSLGTNWPALYDFSFVEHSVPSALLLTMTVTFLLKKHVKCFCALNDAYLFLWTEPTSKKRE